MLPMQPQYNNPPIIKISSVNPLTRANAHNSQSHYELNVTFSTLQPSSEDEAMGRPVTCSVNASMQLFTPQRPLCHCECTRPCQLCQVIIGWPCRSSKKPFGESPANVFNFSSQGEAVKLSVTVGDETRWLILTCRPGWHPITPSLFIF